MSLAWSKDLIAKGWHQFLPVNQHVFSLMPLRHSNEAANLHIVMQHIEEREAKEEANTQYVTTTSCHLFLHYFSNIQTSGKVQKDNSTQDVRCRGQK